MWNSSVEVLNMEPHQMPSLYQSLLWGFSPVGASTEAALNEPSRYPMSVAADAATTYPKRSIKIVNSGKVIRLMPCCLSTSTPDIRMLLDGDARCMCQVSKSGNAAVSC